MEQTLIVCAVGVVTSLLGVAWRLGGLSNAVRNLERRMDKAGW